MVKITNKVLLFNTTNISSIVINRKKHIHINLIHKLWRHGVVVINTAQLHSTKPELRFCGG